MAIKTENLEVTNEVISLPVITSVSKLYGAKRCTTTNANLGIGFASLNTASLDYVYFPVLEMTATAITAGAVVFSIDITDFVKSTTKGRKITEINVIYQINTVNLSAHSIKLIGGNFTNAGGVAGEVFLAGSSLQTTQNSSQQVYKTNIAIPSPTITNYDQYIAEITFTIADTGVYQFNGLEVISEENFY